MNNGGTMVATPFTRSQYTGQLPVMGGFKDISEVAGALPSVVNANSVAQPARQPGTWLSFPINHDFQAIMPSGKVNTSTVRGIQEHCAHRCLYVKYAGLHSSASIQLDFQACLETIVTTTDEDLFSIGTPSPLADVSLLSKATSWLSSHTGLKQLAGDAMKRFGGQLAQGAIQYLTQGRGRPLAITAH